MLVISTFYIKFKKRIYTSLLSKILFIDEKLYDKYFIETLLIDLRLNN